MLFVPYIVTAVNAIWYLMPNRFYDCVSKHGIKQGGLDLATLVAHLCASCYYMPVYIVYSSYFFVVITCLVFVCKDDVLLLKLGLVYILLSEHYVLFAAIF